MFAQHIKLFVFIFMPLFCSALFAEFGVLRRKDFAGWKMYAILKQSLLLLYLFIYLYLFAFFDYFLEGDFAERETKREICLFELFISLLLVQNKNKLSYFLGQMLTKQRQI
jgi:hypothetical protein